MTDIFHDSLLTFLVMAMGLRAACVREHVLGEESDREGAILEEIPTPHSRCQTHSEAPCWGTHCNLPSVLKSPSSCLGFRDMGV